MWLICLWRALICEFWYENWYGGERGLEPRNRLCQREPASARKTARKGKRSGSKLRGGPRKTMDADRAFVIDLTLPDVSNGSGNYKTLN